MAVTLVVSAGPLKGKRFALKTPGRYIAGRSPDCQIRLPDDPGHRSVSRRHFVLEVQEPHLQLRDLGSLNGTYLNDRPLGRRPEGRPSPDSGSASPWYGLREGDRIRAGEMVFMVRPAEEAVCAGCGRPVRAAGQGQVLCAACQSRMEKTRLLGETSADEEKTVLLGPEDLPAEEGACLKCGRMLSDRTGVLCPICRREPEAVLRALVVQAEKGESALAGLKEVRIVRELGRGAAGTAFLVEDRKTGAQTAFKMLLPEVAASERARRMFQREMEISKILEHPHVVRVLDVGQYRDVFFYFMEFCSGGSLDKVRDRSGGRLPLDEALPIVLQVLDGLEYIHSVEIPRIQLADGRFGQGRGLVHRDLKPANIFLSGDGTNRRAKIADVGVGKAFDTAGLSGHTRTGAVAGTPVFMPRFQVVNFKYAKPEVDVWALAATFYNLLTGQFPRTFQPGQDPWMTVLQTNPVPIRERDPALPARLAEVIDAALKDRSGPTFTSAISLKDAILEAV
jgi:serine/threonine-protein kinase